VVPINWNQVLSSIREDFQAFIDDGGWRFLQDDQEDGAEEGENSED
jgi:nucleosome binding factor SPN SPT16 subunit